MAVAYKDTQPRKLSLPCGTRTFQALILSTVVFLAASTAVVVGTEPQPPSSGGGGGGCRRYRFELTHVDANLGLSSDELMRRAYDRSRLRAATLYGTAADPPDSDSDSDSDSGSGSAARHPAYLSKLDASYIIKFYMDDRNDRLISAVVDTGSVQIWTTEAECALSTTRSVLPCCSPKCDQRANCGCSTDRSSSKLKTQDEAMMCKYSITYGGQKDKKTAAGVVYEDKLTFVAVPGNQSFEKIAIGCSTNTTIGFHGINVNGIVGLGRAAKSLPGQLNFNKFSYCLSSYYKPDLPSYLLLTDAPDMGTGATGGAAVATTGLLQNDEYKTRYFVELQGISIGGTRLNVTMKSASGGNMFVDTGATYTHLEESVFKELVEKLDDIMKGRQYIKEQGNDDSICYSRSTTVHADKSSALPQMVLHFDSADMVLPPHKYLWKTSKLCLAISKIKGMSVLGNFQMQGIHMLFDTQNDKLSFVPADCSKV